MVRRNVQVPMYQARIPIGGGGGLSHIDLTERAEDNPIARVLQQIMERKRQQSQGRLAKVGDKWGFISETGDFQPIPTPPPSAVKLLEEYAKGTKAAAGIEEAGTGIPPEVLDAMLKPMEEGLLERGGYEEVEMPGEKRKRFGIDWLAKDIPPRKEIRKKTPITEALTETKQKVKMKAPDGKTYEVDRSEVKEAKKRGWVVL